jgi:hypothetical protein
MKNLIILMTALVLFVSCGKDGAPGATGPAGSSNVSSYVYDVSSWVLNTGNNEFYVDLSVPEITSSVVSGGTVQVFQGNASSNSSIWYALPNSFQGQEVGYSISNGNVRIEISLDNGLVPPTPTTTIEYKIVIIPPV